MKAFQTLPYGYGEILKIDLQNDRKTALKVNLLGVALMILVFAAGALLVPIGRFFNTDSLSDYLIRFAVYILGSVAYIVLHELTHAAAMKAVGGGKVIFGFTGMYAFAGSREDWFDKTSYRLIALAPLVVWGILFGILAAIVPEEWFWVVWFLQAGNVAGAAGDVYVTARLWKSPSSILVRDTGTDMTVYDMREN